MAFIFHLGHITNECYEKCGKVRCPFNLYVTPLHQKDFPRLDRAFFTIYGDSGFQFSKDVWKKLFQFSAIFNPGDRTLRVMGHFTQLGEKELSEQAHTLEVYCQIPPHYEIDVNCSDNNNVNIEYFQSPRVNIQTKRGECTLKNVVTVLFTEREGSIRASKLQGPFVRLKVENSDIRVKSTYSEHFLIQGQHGKFRLGSLHGHGIVDLNSGSIRIGAVDGDVSLQCEKGDMDVFFSATGSSTIRAQNGDVRLGIIDTVSVRLNLVGKRVQVDEDAEHFHMETTKKAGIVQVQGYITDQSSGSSIDVTASKGTIELNI
ncbi:unnamed protein product [Adineta ricciae]|uniref:DUF4097 domain-containing protein n=1 Tax=Adineta ricciae TaxID=249248 RepID=A0A814I9Y8_ADIRI|nr:unnamed protein product [Adineta ricciae]